jgi:Uroporphyrinogen decarboxylase (URO-D)
VLAAFDTSEETMFQAPTTYTAQLVMDTILQVPRMGIPSWLLNVMDHGYIERIAGVPPGEYKKRPEEIYLSFQQAIGTCLLDQWIPLNPLTIGSAGFEQEAEARKNPTSGKTQIICDGIPIVSPEAVVEHLEWFVFPGLRQAISSFDGASRYEKIVEGEVLLQRLLGPTILKSGYDFIQFPTLAYSTYGYTNYFLAYAAYPEVIETHFSLQADLALLNNRAAARAYNEAGLPPLYRLDHDMADSRGLLVKVDTLDKIWLPHFARCLEPLLKTEVRLIWHCDGNLMQMIPRLLEVGIRGFQGFQYEDRMDYERICQMKTKSGEGLIIIAGVSVTRTLPYGTPSDVRRELAWLIEKGPKTGLFLGASSSITPGVPWENLITLVEGLQYYQIRGRS